MQSSVVSYEAKPAGEVLAKFMGRPKPFTAAQMWRFARLKYFRTIRLGRRVFFPADALEAFVAGGGTYHD